MFRIIRVPSALDKFFRPLHGHFHWDHFTYFRLLVLIMAFMWGRRNCEDRTGVHAWKLADREERWINPRRQVRHAEGQPELPAGVHGLGHRVEWLLVEVEKGVDRRIGRPAPPNGCDPRAHWAAIGLQGYTTLRSGNSRKHQQHPSAEQERPHQTDLTLAHGSLLASERI
jgi:hypothetical protein